LVVFFFALRWYLNGFDVCSLAALDLVYGPVLPCVLDLVVFGIGCGQVLNFVVFGLVSDCFVLGFGLNFRHVFVCLWTC